MSDTIISVENLSKSYLIGHQSPKERYTSLRDTLSLHAKNLTRRTLETFRGRQMLQGDIVEEFWALKDVSFKVKQGEVLGIIGRNGAGKSTLLKILSRITEPTRGRVVIDGRVASLLEVGTGFHPELTGRENIFLNGSILGMGRKEIKSKFEEIVDFADVERFLDTPVKRYSSGMYVRLAFAVAAHLEPEILVVDEVLAVGDVEFQKKCMGKMHDVASGGRTVIFVSHNMSAVRSLTQRCILLHSGELRLEGTTDEALRAYLDSSNKSDEYVRENNYPSSTPFIESAHMETPRGRGSRHVSGDSIQFKFKINHGKPLLGTCFSFQIVNQYQQSVVHFWIYDSETPICREGGITNLVCKIPRLSLNVGDYTLTCYLTEPPGGSSFEIIEGICHFTVEIIDRQTLFGWRPDACTYLEEHSWNVSGIYDKNILDTSTIC